MARITVQDCLGQVGNENRFALIHLAVSRVKQLRKGTPLLVKGKNKEAVMSLREIASGKVTFENIHNFIKPQTPAEAVDVKPQQTEAQEETAVS